MALLNRGRLRSMIEKLDHRLGKFPTHSTQLCYGQADTIAVYLYSFCFAEEKSDKDTP